jgi:hypothetical protein
MIDEDSDWISFHAAVAYVEATLQCYHEKAASLVRQAANDLKLRSRTVDSSSPGWLEDRLGRIYSDGGQRNEVRRQDVLELWPERQKDATRPTSAKIEPNAEQRHPQPISNGIRSAISDLWPGGIPAHLMAKERDEQIKKWLQDNNKKISVNISRTIQRVLEAKRKTHPD